MAANLSVLAVQPCKARLFARRRYCRPQLAGAGLGATKPRAGAGTSDTRAQLDTRHVVCCSQARPRGEPLLIATSVRNGTAANAQPVQKKSARSAHYPCNNSPTGLLTRKERMNGNVQSTPRRLALRHVVTVARARGCRRLDARRCAPRGAAHAGQQAGSASRRPRCVVAGILHVEHSAAHLATNRVRISPESIRCACEGLLPAPPALPRLAQACSRPTSRDRTL